jgi:hypothetical protein
MRVSLDNEKKDRIESPSTTLYRPTIPTAHLGVSQAQRGIYSPHPPFPAIADPEFAEPPSPALPEPRLSAWTFKRLSPVSQIQNGRLSPSSPQQGGTAHSPVLERTDVSSVCLAAFAYDVSATLNRLGGTYRYTPHLRCLPLRTPRFLPVRSQSWPTRHCQHCRSRYSRYRG